MVIVVKQLNNKVENKRSDLQKSSKILSENPRNEDKMDTKNT